VELTFLEILQAIALRVGDTTFRRLQGWRKRLWWWKFGWTPSMPAIHDPIRQPSGCRCRANLKVVLLAICRSDRYESGADDAFDGDIPTH